MEPRRLICIPVIGLVMIAGVGLEGQAGAAEAPMSAAPGAFIDFVAAMKAIGPAEGKPGAAGEWLEIVGSGWSNEKPVGRTNSRDLNGQEYIR